jgi:hypothetical protein
VWLAQCIRQDQPSLSSCKSAPRSLARCIRQNQPSLRSLARSVRRPRVTTSPAALFFPRLTSVSHSRSHLPHRFPPVERSYGCGGVVLPQIRRPTMHPSMTLHPTPPPIEHCLHLRPSTVSASDRTTPPTNRVCFFVVKKLVPP